MGLSDASLLCKIALGIAVLAVLFDVVSLSTNAWLILNLRKKVQTYLGLWNICEGGKTCEPIGSHLVEPTLQSVRAFVLLGFLTGSGCIGALILFIFKFHTKLVRIIVLILSILAVLCTIIGFAVYRARIYVEVETELAYSFYLNIFSAVLYLGVSVCVVINILKNTL